MSIIERMMTHLSSLQKPQSGPYRSGRFAMSFIRCTRNHAFVITAKSGMPGLNDQAAWSADFNSAYIAGKSLTLWKPVKLPSQDRSVSIPPHSASTGPWRPRLPRNVWMGAIVVILGAEAALVVANAP